MPVRHDSAPPSLADLHVGFFIAGMATTLLGPVLRALSQRWLVSDALMGLAFTVQFLGTVSMSALSSSLVVRFGGRRVMLVGFGLLAIGIGTLTVAAWLPGLAAILCYGFGLGLVLPTTNVLVAGARPGREASAVSLVNVSWGGGAVAWPVLVTALGGGEQVRAPLAVLAGLMVAMVLRLLIVRDTGENTAAAVVSRPVAAAGAGGTGAAALVALFSALLFFYAGGESAIGGWVAEHVRRIESTSAARHWTIAPMVFWAALAAGRLATPVVLRALDESRVLVSALCVLLLASTVLALAPSVGIALAAAAVAGFGLAPVFPITFVDLSRTLAPLRPRAIGPAYAMASVGSAVLPWLVGICSTHFGTLRAGLVVPIVSTAAMLTLTGVRLARRRRDLAALQEGEVITHTPQ